MLQKTEGIVLKAIKYSETSIITKIFTREFGQYSFIVPGVRGGKSKSKGNFFQPMQLVELDLYYHPSKSLLKLKEYRPAYIFSQLYTDMVRQSVSIFTLEVLSKCIHEHEVNEDLYDFYRTFLTNIDQASELDNLTPQLFLLELSNILGFRPMIEVPFDERPYFNIQEGTFERQPNHTQLSLDRNESFILFEFLEQNVENFSKSDRLKLLDLLLTYFKMHIPNFKEVTSLEIIRQILK